MDNTNEIELTSEQQEAIDKIIEWVKDPLGRAEFKLGGYAGTGKTTVIKILLRELYKLGYDSRVAAFTGKAVSVLRRKGVTASTLHSLMYDVIELHTGGVEFRRKVRLEDDPYLIIVDESSMISKQLYDDLRYFNKRYLFVGDPGQLEPIGDNPNLMGLPDFVLSKIHRQAEHSRIITFANDVRQGNSGALAHVKHDELWIRPKEITSPEFLSVNQVVVAKNATRHNFNEKIRIFLKHPQLEIVPGDKLICLRNNIGWGVFNGMILFVREIKRETFNAWICNLQDEVDNWLRNIPVWKDPFISTQLRDQKDIRVPKEVIYCDYGYAITCHKSQGSEWEKVLVWNEWMPSRVWDMKRWQYTAITRASESLIFNL